MLRPELPLLSVRKIGVGGWKLFKRGGHPYSKITVEDEKLINASQVLTRIRTFFRPEVYPGVHAQKRVPPVPANLNFWPYLDFWRTDGELDTGLLVRP